MKEAINTASGELITAREAEYSMYYGILLCPKCRKVVSLRKSFTQDGEVIKASFVHRPRESNDESCPYRIDWGSEPLTITTFDIHSKGQIFALLKKRFVNIFLTYRMDDVGYDLKQDLSYKQKDYKGQLIKAASGILSLRNNQGILLQMKDLIHTLGKVSIKNAFDKLPKIDDDNNKRLMVFKNCLFEQHFHAAINRYNAKKNNTQLTDTDLRNCENFQNIIGLNIFFKQKESLSLLITQISAINLDEESLRFSSYSSLIDEKELEIFRFKSHTKVSLLVIDFLLFAAGESLKQKIMHIIFSKNDLLEAATKQFKPEFLETINSTIEGIKEPRNEPFKNFYLELNKEVSKRNIYSDLKVERDYAKFKNFLLFILAEVMIAIVNVNWMRGLPAANDDLLFLNRSKSRQHS
jgi:hypothetical protein